MKIGWGYDIHPLRKGEKLVLGGVDLPFEKGLHGHSDADVLIHAVCDAILGAMGDGDLGQLFPDTDSSLAGIRSTHFLQDISQRATRRGFKIHNLDATIIAQRPRLAPYLPEIRRTLARALTIEEQAINVKATSPEGIGALGRQEAIAALCAVLLEEERKG